MNKYISLTNVVPVTRHLICRMPDSFLELIHPCSLCLQHSIALVVAVCNKLEDLRPKEFNDGKIGATLMVRLNAEIKTRGECQQQDSPVFCSEDHLVLKIFFKLNISLIGTEFLFCHMCNSIWNNCCHCRAVMAVVGTIVWVIRHSMVWCVWPG